MTGHLSPEQQGLYLERALPPAELLAADDHLAACESCRGSLRERAAGERPLAAALGSLLPAERAAAHLTYEQLAAYVDHEADAAEREAVEGHLGVCSMCKEEARDLFAFRETLAASPAEAAEPARARWSLAAFWHKNALRR
jgi:predicted anti-sigma-YlaC factor YlaD